MDGIQYKTCTKCREEKPLDSFHRDGRGGHIGRCKACRAATHKAWRETYREKQARYQRRFHLARYGLTEEEYEVMLSAQGGGCAMCGRPCQTGRRLAVDHDHVTGVVRGLLCVKCNQDLGVYEAVRGPADRYLAENGAGNPNISHGVALAEKRGVPRRGTSVSTARLTDGTVRTIRVRYAAGGVTHRALANEYGVSQNAIGLILRRRTWTHAEALPDA